MKITFRYDNIFLKILGWIVFIIFFAMFCSIFILPIIFAQLYYHEVIGFAECVVSILTYLAFVSVLLLLSISTTISTIEKRTRLQQKKVS